MRINSNIVPNLTTKEITEIKKGWLDKEGQGNKEAEKKKLFCVVVRCDEQDALMLSALFYRSFALRSCCYYGNNELSLYCGDAGYSSNLEDKITMMVQGYLAGKKNCKKKQ